MPGAAVPGFQNAMAAENRVKTSKAQLRGRAALLHPMLHMQRPRIVLVGLAFMFVNILEHGLALLLFMFAQEYRMVFEILVCSSFQFVLCDLC